MAHIMITGATGNIGVELAKHLVHDHRLTLVDQDFSDFPKVIAERSQLITADLTKSDSWDGILDGVEFIIQLAGEADQKAEFYNSLLDLNYKIPHNLYQAALEATKLKRVIVASSIHTVDAYPDDHQIHVNDPVRPSNLYGVSKVYLEGLAAHHAYVNGIESIAIRIADFSADEKLDEEADENGMAMFFSKGDMNHLIDSCLKAELEEPFVIVNGISNNAFPRLSLEEARVKLGYEPKDDAFEQKDLV